MRVLLFADRANGRGSNADCIYDSIDAMALLPGCDVVEVNPGGAMTTDDRRLGDFDAILSHWSVIFFNPSRNYILKDWSDYTAKFKGPKIAFCQDEYRWVGPGRRKLASMGFNVVFSLMPKDQRDVTYGGLGIETYETLAGYVPARLLGDWPSLENRRNIIFYRVNDLTNESCEKKMDCNNPKVHGIKGMEKAYLGYYFIRNNEHGFDMNISMNHRHRVYGDQWNEYLRGSRFTLIAESGVSKELIDAETLATRDEFLEDKKRTVDYGIISPRCFEAAAAKTCMVGLRDRYNGILEADRHYIPIEKDYSNMEEVYDRMRDVPHCQKIVDRTYKEIAENPKYQYGQLQKDILVAL